MAKKKSVVVTENQFKDAIELLNSDEYQSYFGDDMQEHINIIDEYAEKGDGDKLGRLVAFLDSAKKLKTFAKPFSGEIKDAIMKIAKYAENKREENKDAIAAAKDEAVKAAEEAAAAEIRKQEQAKATAARQARDLDIAMTYVLDKFVKATNRKKLGGIDGLFNRAVFDKKLAEKLGAKYRATDIGGMLSDAKLFYFWSHPDKEADKENIINYLKAKLENDADEMLEKYEGKEKAKAKKQEMHKSMEAEIAKLEENKNRALADLEDAKAALKIAESDMYLKRSIASHKALEEYKVFYAKEQDLKKQIEEKTALIEAKEKELTETTNTSEYFDALKTEIEVEKGKLDSLNSSIQANEANMHVIKMYRDRNVAFEARDQIAAVEEAKKNIAACEERIDECNDELIKALYGNCKQLEGVIDRCKTREQVAAWFNKNKWTFVGIGVGVAALAIVALVGVREAHIDLKLNEISRAQTTITQEIGDLGDEIDEVGDKVDDTKGDVDEIKDKIDEVGDKVDDIKGDVDEIKDKVDEIGDKVGDIQDKVNDVEDKVDDIKDIVDPQQDPDPINPEPEQSEISEEQASNAGEITTVVVEETAEGTKITELDEETGEYVSTVTGEDGEEISTPMSDVDEEQAETTKSGNVGTQTITEPEESEKE